MQAKSVLRIMAGFYLLIVAALFWLNIYYCFFATMPWSYVVIAWQMPLAGSHPVVKFVNSRAGGFLVFPVICGWLNVMAASAVVRGFSRKRIN